MAGQPQQAQKTLQDVLTDIENSYIRADVKLAEILEDFREKRQLLYNVIKMYESRIVELEASNAKRQTYIGALENKAKDLGLNAEQLAELQKANPIT